MPALIVQSGPDAGKRFEIDSEVVVGRGEVDCVIDDAELSRRHVTVRVTAAGLEIEDMGSLNGTWYKGKRLEVATVVPDGGVIRLGGKIELLVEGNRAAAADSRTVAAPVVAPPPAAEEAPPAPAQDAQEPTAVKAPPVAPPPPPPPPPEEPEVLSEGPPPTNIPVKPRASTKPPPEPAAPDASTVPPRRRAAPPPPPSKSRRGVVPPGVGAASAPLGAFAPPAKSGRRKVATRLVLPAALTFMVIFATAIALIIYFAAQ